MNEKIVMNKENGICMKKRLLYLLFPVFTLILEILPFGAVCNFAVSPERTQRKTFSYFSLVPYGYANFTPFITALITCVVIVLLLVYCFRGKHSIAKASKVLTGVGAVVSFGQFFLGLNYISIVSVMISLALAAEFILLYLKLKVD